jgi:hypothetical protein
MWYFSTYRIIIEKEHITQPNKVGNNATVQKKQKNIRLERGLIKLLGL